MSFIDRISDDDYQLDRVNDYVLQVRIIINDSADLFTQYDFVARTMTVSGGSPEGGQSVIPFSQLDPEMLHFFRKQLMKLDGKPPALPDDIVKPSAQPAESWVDMGVDGIAQVNIYPQLQRKITKIFNFESRQIQTITENLRTRAESINSPVSFDDVLPAMIERAISQSEQKGKMIDKSFVLRGVSRLDKPGLSK